MTQLFIEVGIVGEDALDDAAERVLSPPQVLFDRLRNHLQEDGRGVDQFEHTDSLDIVLDDQQSNHAWEKKAG